MNRKIKDIVYQVQRLILIIPIMAFIVFPFIILVSNSFKTEGEINVVELTIIPKNVVFSNFKELIEDDNFILSIKNSAMIATITMFFTVVVSLPAAYVIARTKGQLANITQSWIVISKMIPVIMAARPPAVSLSAIPPFLEKLTLSRMLGIKNIKNRIKVITLLKNFTFAGVALPNNCRE